MVDGGKLGVDSGDDLLVGIGPIENCYRSYICLR